MIKRQTYSRNHSIEKTRKRMKTQPKSTSNQNSQETCKIYSQKVVYKTFIKEGQPPIKKLQELLEKVSRL